MSSLTVNVGTTTSEKIALSKNFTSTTELSGTLLNDTDILNPSIRLKCSAATIATCNYMKISDFGRNYFITSIVALTNGTCMVSGHVDVLSSFKAGIRMQEAIVKRQETASAYNLYINDSSLKAYQNPHVLTKRFPRGFNGFSYVLSIAGVKSYTPVVAPSVITDLACTKSAGTSIGYKYVLTWSAATNADYYRILKRRYLNGEMQDWEWLSGPYAHITTTTVTYDNQPNWKECDLCVLAYNDYDCTWSRILHLDS